MALDEPSDLHSLAEREARLAEAEEVAHMGSWVWHVDTNAVYWSDELFRILGLVKGEDEASFENWFEAIHPEDLAGMQADAARMAATGETYARTVRIIRADGETRIVRTTSKQVRNDEGAPLRLVGTVLDVTESLAQETELARALDRLRDAQRLANVGSWSWDIRNGSVDWSEQMFRIAEVDPDSFVPTVERFFGLVHSEDLPLAQEAHDRSRAGDPVSLHCRLVLASGETRHVELEAQVDRYAEGQPAVIVGTMMDLTERHELEEQLRQSQKMEALGKLAGGVAHDLNNYLQIIAGNIELLERGDPRRDVETRQARQDVRTSLQLCSSLTQGLLAFSRRQTVEPRPVDLHRIIESSLALVGRLLGPNIEVQTRLRADAAVVFCDPHQIEQVLFNLAINARDAMADGGTLTVSTSTVPDTKLSLPAGIGGDGRAIRVTVSDTGTGMSEAVRSRVFDPFFTTKPKGRSTGLGLAIVYGIVQQNLGDIEVESKPGEGTHFFIDFPLVSAELTAPDSRPDDDEPHEASAKRVLIAEDDRMVRRVTAIMLRKAGYEVVEFVDGQDALEYLDSHDDDAVDLIITDVMMPRLTGVEFVQALRERRRKTPILLMTGYAEQELVEMGPASDQPILFKPFPRADLLRSVAELLDE